MATPTEAKIGFATLSDGKTAGEIIQLKLTPEVLILLREEYVQREVDAEENGNESMLDSNMLPPGVILPRLEKQWVVYSSIPLLYAYLTRYVGQTDQLRFRGDRIKMMNRLLLPEEQIQYMGWTQERGSPGNSTHGWKPKFVALKGPDIYLFDIPPMQSRDWMRCDTVFQVYECMFKILQDSELLDDKQHCCSIQTSSKETIYLTLESRSDLLQLEKAWYRTNHSAVTKLKSKTFGCVHHGRLSGLTLDIDVGFSLYDSETKTYLWTYKFSRLKGSSDDGKQTLKLHFSSEKEGQTETRKVECSSLQLLLYCIHSFLSAKLASVDPSFLANM
ncbi:gamma-1-syntrophin-like [Ruditapes philippinarum]|uniref:gamma-1-syntrophin-like n=1 Tax=Ruditapes philippinarum TaxID=129788 RepID=UPI00295BE147|nr:gamma-1-syntrophin-like [Ruditapes philippinarum]